MKSPIPLEHRTATVALVTVEALVAGAVGRFDVAVVHGFGCKHARQYDNKGDT